MKLTTCVLVALVALASCAAVVRADTDCDKCIAWMRAAARDSHADPFLSDSKSIALDVCAAVADAESRALCTAFVTTSWEQVLNIAAKQDPRAVCAVAGICQADANAPSTLSLRRFGELISLLPGLQSEVISLLHLEPNPLPDCDECVAAFDDAKTHIDEKKFVNHAVFLGKKACKIVEMYEEECDKLVDQFTPLALQLIKNTDSKKLCGYMHICPAAAALDTPTGACVACRHTVRNVGVTIKNAPETQVAAVWERICDLEPSMKDDCMRAEPLARDFVRVLRPRPICNKAGACQKLVAEPNTDYCAFCKGYLAQLKIEMKKPEKQAMARSIISEACTMMPTWTERCSQLLNDYFVKAIHRLEKQDPHKVCMSIGVCTSEMILLPQAIDVVRPLLRVIAAMPANSAKCVTCQVGVKELEKELLDPAFREKLLDTLKHMCDHLGPVKDGCTKFITESFPMILDVLGTWPAITECEISGACNPADDRMAPPDPNEPPMFTDEPEIARKILALLDRITDAQCTGCQLAVEELQALIKDAGVVDKVKDAVHHFCHMLGPMESTCDSMVDSLLQSVISAVLEQDPHTICMLIGMCKDSDLVLEPEVLIPPVADDNDITCEACVHAITEIQNLLYNRDIVHKIFEEIAALCHKIHAAEDVCKDLVSQLVGAVLQLIVQTPPRPLCWLLSLCDMAEETIDFPLTAPMPYEEFLVTLQGTNDMSCDTCVAVIGVAQQMAQDPVVDEKIKGLIHKACEKIPQRDVCESMVDPLIDAAIQAFVDVDSHDLCHNLKLCKASEFVLPMYEVFPNGNSDVGCDSCKVAVSELKDLLADESMHVTIKDFLKKACVILHDQAKTCEALVGTFVDMTIQYIEDKSVLELCTFFKACKKASDPMPVHNNVLPSLHDTRVVRDMVTGMLGDEFVDNGYACEICKMGLTEVQAVLKDPATLKKIHKFAESVCDYFADYKAVCVSAVDYGIDYVINEVESKSPEEECVLLHLCDS